MKDNKVSEMKNGEKETQRYESLIDRFLRSPWRIEINHVKSQWDHGYHIGKHQIIAMDPKMENKNDNREK